MEGRGERSACVSTTTENRQVVKVRHSLSPTEVSNFKKILDICRHRKDIYVGLDNE